MIHLPTYDPTLDLQNRKLQLEHISNTLESYYCLSRADLANYLATTSLIPDYMQVDLIIHLLDLYQSNKSMDEIIPIIHTVLDDNPTLLETYKSGNLKVANSIIGLLLKKDKSLNPKEVLHIVQQILQGL